MRDNKQARFLVSGHKDWFAMRESLGFLKSIERKHIFFYEMVRAIMFLFLFWFFFISVATTAAENTQRELDLIKNAKEAADKE